MHTVYGWSHTPVIPSCYLKRPLQGSLLFEAFCSTGFLCGKLCAVQVMIVLHARIVLWFNQKYLTGRMKTILRVHRNDILVTWFWALRLQQLWGESSEWWGIARCCTCFTGLAWFTGKRRIHKMFQTYFFFMLFKEQVDSNVIGSRASMLCVIHCLLVYARGGHWSH